MKLHPRLPSRFARQLFEQQSATGMLDIHGSTSHPYTTWAATGAPRITDEELGLLRDRINGAAAAHGAPEPLARERQRSLDLALARLLWEWSHLTAAEAGLPDTWSFVALVLAPEAVWWRAAGSTNIERFVASDLTRHTLARLWWRAQLFTHGLSDPETGWSLWRDSDIGEADLDQIQTRRGGYGRSPRTFRALVSLYPDVTGLANERGFDRRTFWRQAYLRWILRLGAFSDFGSLPESALRSDLLAVAHELADDLDVSTVKSEGEGHPDDRQPDASSETPTSFDQLPLCSLLVSLTAAIRATPHEIDRTEFPSAFERETGIPVPASRAEILAGIVWHGKTLKYLDGGGKNGTGTWRPGKLLPAPDRRWHDWSIQSFAAHLVQTGERDLDAVCAELFAGRAGLTVKRVARAALELAQG
jgi:hypothetical protein